MKKPYYLFLILVTLLIVCWLFAHYHPIAKPEQVLAKNSATNLAQPVLPTPKSLRTSAQPQNIQQASAQLTNTPPAKPLTVEEWLEREYSHPFFFYGKVVDQDGVPVQGATADFQWASPKGNEQNASSVSDSLGLFSLEKGNGYKLLITVSKTGYYTPNGEKLTTIAYGDESGRETFKANPINPIVFHLQKRGVGVDLITSQYGISPDFPIHIPRDGAPIKIDFMQRKAGDSGQMIVTENKPEFKDWKQATSWSFKMEIPDGGFIEENDEFPFEAPETGYQSAVEYNFQQSQPDWTINLKKDFYIKFGNPPLYGRLHIETGISYGGATLTYAINPTGSRNLEPK